jgi:hypothetical protein
MRPDLRRFSQSILHMAVYPKEMLYREANCLMEYGRGVKRCSASQGADRFTSRAASKFDVNVTLQEQVAALCDCMKQALLLDVHVQQVLLNRSRCTGSLFDCVLVLQIFEEISERQDFIERMSRLGLSEEAVSVAKLEIATRMRELNRLGVDTSFGRPTRLGGQSNPNHRQTRM